MKQENSDIISEAEKVKDYLFIVEGKKDRAALENLGFENIFVLNESGKSLGEKIEQIEEIAKSKICILTDFDKKGRSLYKIIKSELSKRNVRLDNRFRNFLSKEGVLHIEDI